MSRNEKNKKCFIVMAAVIVCFAFSPPQAEADTWLERQKILASDSAANNWFGYSISISGDYAIVGAPAAYNDGNGSAYIFKREGASWVQQQELLASDGNANDNFGISVSISGDYAIVGAYQDGDNGIYSGSAYIFKRGGTSWSEQDKLTASDGAAGDRFGWSVSVSGDYAIVGAQGDDVSKGSAYILKRDGTSWSEQAKLLALDGAGSDYFGWSVSIGNGYIITGAYFDDDKGTNSGSAYMFGKTLCPSVDLNDDCKVDLADFAVFAAQWLYGTD